MQGTVILHEHQNYQGSSVSFTDVNVNLADHNFNDKTSSLKINGKVTLWDNPNWSGWRAITFTSETYTPETGGTTWNCNPSLVIDSDKWDSRIWGWTFPSADCWAWGPDDDKYVDWIADGFVESRATSGPGQPLIAANFDQGYENNAVSDRCPDLPFGGQSLTVDGSVTLYDQPDYQGNCKSFTNERVAYLGDWAGRAESLIVDGSVSLWQYPNFDRYGYRLFFTKVSAQPAPLKVSTASEIRLEGVVTDWWWNWFSQESAAGIKFDVILTENHSDSDAVRLMMELYIVRLGSGCWTWGGWPPGSNRKCTLFPAPPTYFYRAAIDHWSEYVTRTIYPGEVMQWFINLKPLIQDACNDFSLNINNLYIAKISYTLEADGFLTSPSISCNLHRLRLSYTLPSGGHPGGGECPTLFAWNGTGYVSEGVLAIHAESDITVQHTLQNTLALKNGVYGLELRELDNFTSHIDQVRLYAIDNQGEWHLSPLLYANHSELGWVTWRLRFDDENKVDMTPTQTIALRFLPSIPYSQTAYFVFETNGHNRKALY